MMRLVWWFALMACGEGSAERAPPQSFIPAREFTPPLDQLTSILDGDWFFCVDPLCARFDDDGLRFFAGATLQLESDGDPYAGYCFDELDGFYEIVNASPDLIVIRLVFEEALLITFELLDDGNLMRGVAEGIDEEVLLRRIVFGPVVEPCEEFVIRPGG